MLFEESMRSPSGTEEPLRNWLDRITDGFSPRSQAAMKKVLESEADATWQLRLTPAAELFDDEERQLIDGLAQQSQANLTALRLHTVVILKATRLCNLRCTYCNSWRAGPGNIMPMEVLTRVTRDVLRTSKVETVAFVWHGGEVTLLPIEYLRKALWLQQRFARPETQIDNSLQTNATRLTEEWIELFAAHNFSIGVSIDGPPEVHDSRRLTIAGGGSWKHVRRGIDMLKDAQIPFGALAVVDQCVLKYGAERYLEYLMKIGVRSFAMLNVLPANTQAMEDRSNYLPWAEYTDFLRDLFAVWWRHYRAEIQIRELQALVEAVERGTTSLCVFRDNCMGQYLTVDPNGDISACDKFVGDSDHIFGNILDRELNDMLSKSKRLSAAHADVKVKKSRMSSCPNYKYCFGGCPHDVRLGEKYIPGWSPKCCGLSGLIEDIQEAVGA